MNHPPQEAQYWQQPHALLAELAQRTLDRCDAVAAFSEEPGRITRTFCSPAMADLHAALRGWMEAAGMACRVDAAGNFFGRLTPTLSLQREKLLIGSHLDSVPNAGKYDGVLGVMLGLALAEAVNAIGLCLPFDIEVVGFSEEEGVRYGVPFIGSRALVGDCDGALLQRKDTAGVVVADALRQFGCDPAQVGSCELPPEEYLAYLEPHIEQGPVLECEKSPLSVVTAIAGQTRATIRFAGAAGHAGTVPMSLRRDALAAAAEWITQVERIGQLTFGLVATVGTIEVLPGAGNVIPGEARLRLDVRHTDDSARKRAVDELQQLGQSLATRRGVAFEFLIGHEHAAVGLDRPVTDFLRQSITRAGHRPIELPSGAGHDAAVMARRWPTTMLFIRCRGGVSHHPDEAVTHEDVTAALTAMWHFLDVWRLKK